MEGLGRRVIRGSAWMGGSVLCTRAVSLAGRLLVLAALLGPEQMGVFGVAALATAALDSVSRLGIDQALIRHEHDIDALIDTAWVLQLVRGLLLGGGLFLAAGAIADFFNAPEARAPLRALACAPLLLGLRNTAMVALNRDLRFGIIFGYETGAVLLETVVAIAYALVWPTAWALVVGRLAAAVYQCGYSYVVVRRRPRFAFSASACRAIFAFSAWVLASAVLTMILVRGGDVVIGALLPLTVLAHYQLAYQLASMPAREVTRALNTVLLPAYSSVQTDRPRLARTYLASVGALWAILGLGACLTVAGGGPLVHLALGTEWHPMIAFIPGLVVVGCGRAFGANANTLYQAIGRPALTVVFQVAMAVALGALLFALGGRGGEGVVLALAITSVASVLARMVHIRRLLAIGWLRLLTTLGAPVVAALLAVFAAQALTPDPLVGAGTALGVALGVAAMAYLGALLVWEWCAGAGPLHHLRAMWAGRMAGPPPEEAPC